MEWSAWLQVSDILVPNKFLSSSLIGRLGGPQIRSARRVTSQKNKDFCVVKLSLFFSKKRTEEKNSLCGQMWEFLMRILVAHKVTTGCLKVNLKGKL